MRVFGNDSLTVDTYGHLDDSDIRFAVNRSPSLEPGLAEALRNGRTAPVPRPSELPEQLLTVDEVAALLRVCRATAYRMVKDGKLFSLRAGNVIRIPRSAIAVLLAAEAQVEPS